MIRILQVVTSMEVGGIEVLLMNLYRNIDRTLVQFDFLLHRQHETHFEKEIIGMGGRIYRVPSLNPYHHFSYLNALDAFFAEHSEYRIIHAHNNAFSMFVLRAAKKAGIPICIAHSHLVGGSFLLAPLKTTLAYYCKKKIVKYLDFTFACSEEAAYWLFGKALSGEKTPRVLRNGVDVERFQFNEAIRKRIKNELGIHPDDFVVGHVGRFSTQKNHKLIIDIFREIVHGRENSRLILVGEGDLLEKIKASVIDFGLERNVMFLGIRDDVDTLMQAMDIFLFPSLFEGLGLVLIEAQASGLPCLVSDTVPHEVKVIDNLEFISLQKTASFWAEKAIGYVEKNDRKDTAIQIINAGYDIKKTAKWLEHFYIKQYDIS